MKRSLLVLLVLYCLSSVAQDTSRRAYKDTNITNPNQGEPDLDLRPENNIFLNILGDGSIISLNYERLFFTDPRHFFIAAGAGVGVNSLLSIHFDNISGTTYSTKEFVVIPHHISGNIGGGSHFFEFGVGATALTGDHARSYLPYLIAGYRLQPRRDNRVHFRLFGSFPLDDIEEYDLQFVPVGISVGWSF
jgi:hypothetical protein